MLAPKPQPVLRTSATMYALFGGISGAVFMLATLVTITKEPTFWFPTAITGGILIAFLSWMATTSLTLASESIHYRSLFVRKNVQLSDIVKVAFIVGFSSFKPHQRLVLTIRKHSGVSEVTINMGLFDRGEIRRWVDALNARLS
jgi:hypothetical protein